MQEDSGFRRLLHWQKVVVAAFLSASFALLLTVVCLDGYFCHNRPKTPMPHEGRVYLTYVCHGGIVYLTRLENVSMEGLSLISLLVGCVAIFLGRRWARVSHLNQIRYDHKSRNKAL